MMQTLIKRSRLPLGHIILFGWMPSPLRRLAYRWLLGYEVGRGVSFAFGSAVVGKKVRLADHVSIGLLTVVQGRQISIGRHSSIGMMSYLSCERIEIGEDARIREQVFVGGPALPESLFKLGDRTIVLQQANINPTKPVIIGNDSGIGGHCLIFTHGAWLNQMDGYPVTYEPVSIGESVWLPWRVFVMPGATIGDGSVIGANSLVTGAIPPYSLAVGSPAKVIRSAPNFPKQVSEAERQKMVVEMMGEFDLYMAYEEVVIERVGECAVYRAKKQPAQRLFYLSGTVLPLSELRGGDTVLALRPLQAVERADLLRIKAYWLDLAGRTRSEQGAPLTEELAQFLFRYGIRLPRSG